MGGAEINGQDAMDMAVALARQEGIFCGISAGGTFAAALKAFRDIDAFARRFLAVQPVAIDPSRVPHESVGYREGA